MPVYDRGYTHWEHSGRQAWPAWWVIARRGIAAGLKHKGVTAMALLALVPAIVKGGIIYASLQAGDMARLLTGGWTSIDPEGFLRFLEMQRFSVFAVMALVGAGLIAQDRQDNGLSLYFARPLGLRDYLLGKALILVFFYCLVTLAPALLLSLYAYWVAPDAAGLDLLLLTPLRLLVYCVLSGLSMSLVLLAFSSLGKRPIFVMVWWTILVMGTEAFGGIARLVKQDAFEAANFLGQYHNAGAALFGAGARLGVPQGVSLLLVAGWTFLAVWLLRRRIRPVEVVS
jgi:ABC-2 type transport system permease protein